MADIDPIVQHIIEQEAIRSAVSGDLSHIEAMMALISAEMTAEAIKKRIKQPEPDATIAGVIDGRRQQQ